MSEQPEAQPINHRNRQRGTTVMPGTNSEVQATAPAQPLLDWNGLLTTKQAADLCRLNFKTLQNWRQQGKGPQYLKLGGRVFYRRSDLAAWVEGSLRPAYAKP